MINLQEVGVFVKSVTRKGVEARFGIYLPGITPKDGYDVHVLVLHKKDHFNQNIDTHGYKLQHVPGSEHDLWQKTILIPPEKGTHLGQAGIYLYRYELHQSIRGATNEKKIITKWFTDPFARDTDIGLLSAFVTPEENPRFKWTDHHWKTPELERLVVYELNIQEFNSNFDGVVERLPYLKSLGITCLELMPITSLKLNFNWGYEPLHYFAPYQRWGGTQGLKRLINSCHEAGIAVILDVVYQHVDPTFPYHLIYKDAGLDSPMTGGDGPFGPEIDYNKDFARDYVQTANRYWLHEYHIDGFRYDEVTDLYDGPMGIQYAQIAYNTYMESLNIVRFLPSGKGGAYSRIIQCSEALNRPQEVLANTYTTNTWQDGLLWMSQEMARSGTVDENFVPQVILEEDFAHYPATKEVKDIKGKPIDMPVAPFQYLENHDHSQLISAIAMLPGDVPFGDRSKFFKLQPFAIALYTCVGTPMLWEGQEFAQNYVLPDTGQARVLYQRNVSWEFFYDDFGTALIHLYRTLGTLRQKYPALRSRESFYFRAETRIEDGIVAYARRSGKHKQNAIVVLNFSPDRQSIEVPFLEPGTYREMIDDDARHTPYEISVENGDQRFTIEVPAHYGFVFIN